MKINNIKIKLPSFIILLVLILFVIFNYKKIPSKKEHMNRNRFNIMPVGNLRQVKDNIYIDENRIIWLRRNFFQTILHNPFSNYIFETYDKNNISSSEVQVDKSLFNNGKQNFIPSSFNYYSSFQYPISHLFSDVLPIILYFFPDYNRY